MGQRRGVSPRADGTPSLAEKASGAPEAKMAALGRPLRTFRSLLRELRYTTGEAGRAYRDSAAYQYLKEAFRAHRVSGGGEAAAEAGGLGDSRLPHLISSLSCLRSSASAPLARPSPSPVLQTLALKVAALSRSPWTLLTLWLGDGQNVRNVHKSKIEMLLSFVRRRRHW